MLFTSYSVSEQFFLLYEKKKSDADKLPFTRSIHVYFYIYNIFLYKSRMVFRVVLLSSVLAVPGFSGPGVSPRAINGRKIKPNALNAVKVFVSFSAYIFKKSNTHISPFLKSRWTRSLEKNEQELKIRDIKPLLYHSWKKKTFF